MRFEYYTDALADVPKLSIDGTVGNAVHFSHWKGNQTPASVKADTSTEIALNLIAAPNREELTRGIELATNNHFDTDGVLSVWTVLTGERAPGLRHRLIPAAEAGHFSGRSVSALSDHRRLCRTSRVPVVVKYFWSRRHSTVAGPIASSIPIIPGLRRLLGPVSGGAISLRSSSGLMSWRQLPPAPGAWILPNWHRPQSFLISVESWRRPIFNQTSFRPDYATFCLPNLLLNPL